jgi:hypothetical protein
MRGEIEIHGTQNISTLVAKKAKDSVGFGIVEISRGEKIQPEGWIA